MHKCLPLPEDNALKNKTPIIYKFVSDQIETANWELTNSHRFHQACPFSVGRQALATFIAPFKAGDFPENLFNHHFALCGLTAFPFLYKQEVHN